MSPPVSAAVSPPVSALLDRLRAGALDWLGENLGHFDALPASHARPATRGRAKAALELALLCHCAARLDGGPPDALGEAAALIRRLWQHPDFPGLLDEGGERYAAVYALVYAALAPRGIDDALCRAALSRLPPGALAPGGKTAYQRLEIRYYADKAGVRHGIEPYADLAPRSPLVTLRAATPDSTPDSTPENTAPLTTGQAYALTHATFYLGDFGRARPAGLDGRELGHARELARRMLGHCVAHDQWDLIAELLLTQFILGADPLRTPGGAAAVECLARAQLPNGAIPGRSAAGRAAGADRGREFFRKAYHTTLVTALMALIVAPERRPS
ncbi:DUF6895 family protein [Streptomyces sp. YIM 98790]|uniref:DUF6895 family protein n=1 Tax=Streptomyces sp. YIM 98790 TaxID=2689077 RepID=UPI0028BDE677|nr:hypothetical protein [Streptomyces sp. YIM 98790]